MLNDSYIYIANWIKIIQFPVTNDKNSIFFSNFIDKSSCFFGTNISEKKIVNIDFNLVNDNEIREVAAKSQWSAP